MFNFDLNNIPKEKIVLMGDKLIDYIEEITSITGKTIIGHGKLSDINILEKDCNCINNLFEKVGLEKPWDESRETLLQDLQNWYFKVLNRDEYGGFLDEFIETSDFRIAACNCCTALLRDKVDTSGQNELLILEKFKSKYNLEQSLPEIKALIKSIYFENLLNDKYGINKLKD